MEKRNKLSYSCAIIIPAVNINNDVIKCVNKCASQYKVKVTIYLVTNKKVKYKFKSKKINFLYLGDVFMSKKRNFAVKKAKEQFIAFIDSDAYPAKRWLYNGIKLLKEKKEIGMVTGPDLPFKDQSHLTNLISLSHRSFFLSGSKSFRKKLKKTMVCSQASSCNMIMRKDIYIKAKGMDESIYIGEDKDLCDKFNRISKILYSPSILIYHRTRDFIPFLLQRFSYGTCLFDIVKNNRFLSFNNLQYFGPLLIVLYYIILPFSILFNLYNNIFYFILIFLNGTILVESLRISLKPLKTIKIFLIIKLNIIMFGLGSIFSFIGIDYIKKIYKKR